jgi:hypothetical protein
MKNLINKIVDLTSLCMLMFSMSGYSQCSAVPWTGWGFATPCVVGSGYYNTGCVVSYDDGTGMRNYTAKGGPHHSNTPVVGGTAYWTDNGLCGGDPPTLDPTATSGDDCMFATVTGKTLTAGGSDIKERGFVWNLTGNPDITTDAANKTVYDNTNTIGSYTTDISVDENKTIYVRSYAINTDDEEGYGDEVSLTTDQSATVTNVSAINIFCESMSLESSTNPKGQFFGDPPGGATITEYGFFYGTSSAAVDAARPGSYAGCSKEVHIARTGKGNSMSQIIRRSEITGLTPNTQYYYKSYTTTNVCTGYGPRKDETTDVACPVYYSCSGAATYDTDPACPNANLTPTAKSIVNFRHDWRLTPGTALTDLAGDLPNQPKIGITPYRIVMQQGGYAYATGSFNAGTQLVIGAGGQFGYEGSPQLIIDGLPGTGLKFARLTMDGGSFVTSAAVTNYLDIALGSGEICNEGSWASNADAPGSVYGNYDIGGGLIFTRYTDADCIGTFTLPVELIEFKGKLKNDIVKLNWVTGSEINNDYFDVERSTDGLKWEVMERIGGNGSKFTVSKYSTDDNDVVGRERMYYRLKQVDYDGQFKYSKNIVVNIDGDGSILQAFNSNGYIQIVYSGSMDNNTSVRLVDSYGRVHNDRELVYSVGKKKKVNLYLNSSDLPTGLYIVQIISGSNVTSKSLIVR